MAQQITQRNPNRPPPPAPLAAGVKSLFIEYQPIKNPGCCNADAYVGILGSLGKKIRGWDHVRLVVVEGKVEKVDANSRGQWWDLGITPGGAQCFYNDGIFQLDSQRSNKYTFFGFTGDQCTGQIITREAEQWIDRFRQDGFNVVFRNCLAFANSLASSILDEKEKQRRAAQAEADRAFQMSGVYIPVNTEWLQ